MSNPLDDYARTFEVFPNLGFYPESLMSDVESIFEKHEERIRNAVLRALTSTRSSTSSGNSAARILNSITAMSTDLLRTALEKFTCICEFDNPPQAYDSLADEFYHDVLTFTIHKYKSAVSEIPGFKPGYDTSVMARRKKEWLRLREGAKRYIREMAKSREIRDTARAEEGELCADHADDVTLKAAKHNHDFEESNDIRAGRPPARDVNGKPLTSSKTPKMLIDDYIGAHPEIANHESLAELIGISRDTLFAIKSEARWVRPAAYQSTAALIGCSEKNLHPHAVTRRRRKGQTNSKSDSKSDV